MEEAAIASLKVCKRGVSWTVTVLSLNHVKTNASSSMLVSIYVAKHGAYVEKKMSESEEITQSDWMCCV